MPATKDQIAATFMQLAARFGYRRTSIEDVAKVLHISKKTIYDYFKSKEELLSYGVELSALEQRRRVESSLTARTALGKVEQVVTMALADARRFYEAEPHAEMLEPSQLAEQIQDAVFRPLVRDLVAEGVASREFEVHDVDTAAAFAMAIGMQAVALIQKDPSSRPEASMIEAMRRLLAGKVDQEART